MIKIYLDHNVYQFLKRPENADFLGKVLESKKHIIYIFSEAHLYDLNQDRTEEKFADMDFIEKIADSNCYFFSDRTRFNNRTPREYYDDFDWSMTHDYAGLMEGMETDFGTIFKQIPLPLNMLTAGHKYPEEMPENMKRLLTSPTNMFDFMNEMLNIVEELKDQPKYREHLQFLHKNSQLQGLYQSIGIEGYDGLVVTDREKFWESFSRKFEVKNQEKSPYAFYIEMFHGLDIFGIVKGKPKKQQMMSLLNDGRHAYFGKYCDIIVSNDADFIKKTRFMYDLEKTDTGIVNLKDFPTLLLNIEKELKNELGELLAELNAYKSSYTVLAEKEVNGIKDEYVQLNNRYFLYFNIMAFRTEGFGNSRLVIKESNNDESGVLTKQIEYIVRQLTNRLGPDVNGKQFINHDEVKNNTVFRTWRINDMFLSLVMHDVLYLNAYGLEYVQARYNAEMPKKKGILTRLKAKLFSRFHKD